MFPRLVNSIPNSLRASAALVLVVGPMAPSPLEKPIVGRWWNKDLIWDFRKNGTFRIERGLLVAGGTYRVVSDTRVRIYFDGISGFVQKVLQTKYGPQKKAEIEVSIHEEEMVIEDFSNQPITLRRY